MWTASSAKRTTAESLSAVEYTATVWMPISRQVRVGCGLGDGRRRDRLAGHRHRPRGHHGATALHLDTGLARPDVYPGHPGCGVQQADGAATHAVQDSVDVVHGSSSRSSRMAG